MVTSGPPAFCYSIDAADAIATVSDRWLAFARENGALELTREFVVGRSIYDFIADVETQTLYAQIIGDVRFHNKRILLPFRCDSPTLRRYMRLEISQSPGQHVQFVSVLLRAEPCLPFAILDRSVRRLPDFVTMCSCCKRILLDTHGWLEVDEAVASLRLFDATTVPSIRYTVCPNCAVVPLQAPDGGDLNSGNSL